MRKVNLENRKWQNSVISRGFGTLIIFFSGGLMSIIDNSKWIPSLIICGLLFLGFYLIVILPDKFIYGKRLRDKQFEKKGAS